MYGSEDPFENGWAASTPPAASQQFPALDQSFSASATPSDISIKVPSQYHEIFQKLSSQVASFSGLQAYVFSPLITESLLTSYQASKIIDILYDHNIMPPNSENNFFHVLGLIALEINSAGTGDFVTLQFKLNSGLPPLPPAAAALLMEDSNEDLDILRDAEQSDVIDPLTSQLANSDLLEEGHQNMTHWDTADANRGSFAAPTSDPTVHDHTALLFDPNVTAPESIHADDYEHLSKHISEIRDRFKPLIDGENKIKIKEVPEKEGLLFKHINYAITHEISLGITGPAGVKKVIRRYSDFVWLLEFLLKKYPFRVIPGLPPKKFTGASPDSQFLQRRRRGLHRFLNQVVKHPVLKQEPIVVTFLTVPTDLVSWKKQARIDYSLEFKGEKILTSFMNSIWPAVGDEFLHNWKNAELGLPKLIEYWTKIVMLVERHEKRQQQIAFDNGKFVEMITKFSDLDETLFPHKVTENKVISTSNTHDTSSINESLSSISAFFDKASTLLIDESYIINTDILEKFKNFLDCLYSLQELFDRSKRLSINTIPQLKQRIQENEEKHERLSKSDVDIKGSELVKLRQTIINDKQEMFQQLNKDWLIKKCCFEEFVMFQETQFLISEAWCDWCRGRFKFQDKCFGLYEALQDEVVSDMPLRR
ncbi:hypothetical protein METBIDRAFT_31804 [Metschnikowia bicuspidata var. bicuspidata NRRL YB-4993]|uniref:Sorting nexin MVP1 n=1 Tax=Metschnikowia bicuspidata var. bicuspidata NRRL YB-4993 TaxID=869754 RepID=A0A1A0HB43_9ASCO|nr:hypothetical protein METBIDRAFT_31804 [Metschnikowia bicuspidata var. bicuspidata NRRL YB-4993]OBA21231.1 hypothetical protein METBIDRAFT_31804 [Metschnikowia bicuspidata var. bicuspidata NRRL YB-4993]